MAYENTPSLSANGTAVSVGSRTDILANSPLSDLNSAGGLAYAARMKSEATADLMGILCTSGMPNRSDMITSMRSIDHPSLLRLIESGVVYWPADDTRYYSFVFQRPVAPRMMHSLDEGLAPLSEDTINHYFITPMIGALAELLRTGLVHNGIRPTNIFWRIGSVTPPQLGECLSAPAGYGQPILFEPIERAVCLPIGRGTGQHADDCYAFGVSLAFLLLGKNPLQGLDDNTIIDLKNERGTFSAIVGNHRLHGSHIEILRGLLTDDAHQRWTATDLEQWLTGRRLTPKNSDAGRRAPRHFDFVGKEYWNMRSLAHAFAHHVSEAVQVIENGVLDRWLRRTVGDDDRANNVAEAQNMLKASGKLAHYEDLLVACVCIALDPSGPIRYRGLAIMPRGIADMVADAALTGNHIQPLSEIMSSQLVTFWVEMQNEAKPEFVPLAQQFERIRSLIEKTSFGNGFERIVYELNPTQPCLSPMLRKQFVVSPKMLLEALERVALSGSRPREPMDRFIASFLIVRDRRSEMLFDAMGGPEGSIRRGLALLTIFSDMQQRYGPDQTPQLAQWIAPLLENAARRYLSKVLREKTQSQMKQIAERGNLAALRTLVDDPLRVERDQQEFMAARMLYFSIMKEINSIENQLANRDSVAQAIGRPMAATISSFLAIILAIVILLRAAWKYLS